MISQAGPPHNSGGLSGRAKKALDLILLYCAKQSLKARPESVKIWVPEQSSTFMEYANIQHPIKEMYNDWDPIKND